MLSSFWRGIALVLFWLFAACVYQSYIRQDNCLPLAMPSKRKSIELLPIIISEPEGHQARELERELNKMSIDLIEIKMTQGIPHGY